ncbi:MAG TPA: nuclear transport factor 2 family protein [Ktedonobacterales bacterium]|nr:nuclear transport factor 2 family protein [Ktedonobacterales bacterium]
MNDHIHPDAFRQAVEQGNHAALMLTLAPNVVFHSPIVHHPYVGRDAVAPLLAAVLQVFRDFAYVDEFTAPDGKVLLFRTRIGERDAEGVDILKFDNAGLVQEFTVMVRPYSAATALREAMAARLAAGPGKPL